MEFHLNIRLTKMNAHSEDGNATDKEPLFSQQSESVRIKITCMQDAAEIFCNQLTLKEQDTYLKME